MVDTIIMILTIHPNCLKRIPAIPVTMVNGRNTANMVSVEAITEIATSLVACTAACFGLLPRSICVVTFSNTTMASSTTIPIAMDSELREMMFNVFPDANKYAKAAINEIGIVRIIINVALQRPRKINTTNITTMKVIMIVSCKLSIVFKMFVEVSIITPSCTSDGKLACISGSFSCTFLAMFTEFAPDCFWITIIPPLPPLLKVS